MNWNVCHVEDHELEGLKKHNQPIALTNHEVLPNEGVELRTPSGKRFNAVYDGNLRMIRQINRYNPVFHEMKNRDLALYNDHLLNPEINTITVDGFFGTGKTSTVCSHLVSGLVAALDRTEGAIQKAYIAKPHVGVGGGYGFLPGDLHDKMAEEMKSFTQYFDRFGNPGLADFLMMRDAEERGRLTKEKTKELQEALLELLPFEYLRGRDIDHGWVILDEAQNTTIKEMTTFLSRPDDAAKAIILGDTTFTQIDVRGNTPEKNGLTFAKGIFHGKRYAAHIELQTVEHILRGQRVRDLFVALQEQR